MLEGQCHCGAVHWTLVMGPDTSGTICNCSYCRRTGPIWSYGDDGAEITVTGDTRAYVWGTGRVGFHLCKVCGCLTHWRGSKPTATGRRRMAVNLRMADPALIAALPLDRFDGLHSFDDMPRDGRRLGDLLP